MTWVWVSVNPPECVACGKLLRWSNRYPTCYYCWRASVVSWNDWYESISTEKKKDNTVKDDAESGAESSAKKPKNS
jgi:hypothetical protein